VDHKTYHFFSGDGVIHGVEFSAAGSDGSPGSVTYRRKFVETPNITTGEDVVGDERGGLANTAMVFHANRLLALEEGSKPYEVGLPLLNTVERVTFDGKLTHNFTAHPKVCPETLDLMFFVSPPHPHPYSSLSSSSSSSLRFIFLLLRFLFFLFFLILLYLVLSLFTFLLVLFLIVFFLLLCFLFFLLLFLSLFVSLSPPLSLYPLSPPSLLLHPSCFIIATI
jgi:hypothetical protein